jgi:hypothetical protein
LTLSAALTKFLGLGNLEKTEVYFATVLEAGKAKIHASAGSLSSEVCSLFPRWHLVVGSSGKEEHWVLTLLDERGEFPPSALL